MRRPGVAGEKRVAAGEDAEKAAHLAVAVAVEGGNDRRARAQRAHAADDRRGSAGREHDRGHAPIEQRVAERGEAIDRPIARGAARDQGERNAVPRRGRAGRTQIRFPLQALAAAQGDAGERVANGNSRELEQAPAPSNDVLGHPAARERVRVRKPCRAHLPSNPQRCARDTRDHRCAHAPLNIEDGVVVRGAYELRRGKRSMVLEHDPVPNQRMSRDERSRVRADEHVDRRIRQCPPQIIEQRRGENHVAEPAQLNEEDPFDA